MNNGRENRVTRRWQNKHLRGREKELGTPNNHRDSPDHHQNGDQIAFWESWNSVDVRTSQRRGPALQSFMFVPDQCYVISMLTP